ncbi:MAG TPA: DedA family protein [Sphingomicrobium sp.]|nr:DedA family protein [Sphingomicrobium sp.]
MTQALIDLLSTPWSYAVILGIAALDALMPVVPSETLAITGGVLAGLGELHLGTVIASAAVGAFVGDSCAYLLGRTIGPPARERLFRGRRARRVLDWAEKQLGERGAYLILIARFVPGGRTATTFTAGMVRFRAAVFFPIAAVAAAAWAAYAVLLGYYGGRVFEEQPLLALGVALGIAFCVTAAVEVARKLRK